MGIIVSLLGERWACGFRVALGTGSVALRPRHSQGRVPPVLRLTCRASPRTVHVALQDELTGAFPHFLFLILCMTVSYQQKFYGLFFFNINQSFLSLHLFFEWLGACSAFKC